MAQDRRLPQAAPGARLSARVLVVALVLAAGCGDDEEERAKRPAAPREEKTTSAPRTIPTETEKDKKRTDAAPGPSKPIQTLPSEESAGGVGDEEPASSLAAFLAFRGRITPRVVRVPPFIAIRAELRSADGSLYRLRIGKRVLRVGGQVGSSSVLLDGLRPGRSYRGVPIGRGNRVRIEATAEPGP
jgi:hypothetical protein